MKLKKKINKGFKTKCIIIKRIRTKFDIKIKCQLMKLKNKTNSINDLKSNTLQQKERGSNLTQQTNKISIFLCLFAKTNMFF